MLNRIVRLCGLAFASLLVTVAAASAQSFTPYVPYTYPTTGVLGTLSTNPYARPTPVVPPSVRYHLPDLLPPSSAPAIVGRDGQYLGRLSRNPYDPQSVNNPYGPYGSKYSPTSINNPYSQYGSRYSPLSVNNPYASAPPLVIGR